MFERPEIGNRAVLVAMDMGDGTGTGEEEFRELAISAGAEVVEVVTGRRRRPDPRYFFGAGKAGELAELVSAQQADLVLINHPLSPSQERNLERLLQCRVLDRTGLILDIFSRRARSFEGKLQVELAQMRHLSTRLVRGWSHLERQKGGIGLRGPGETQLETDRRLVGQRIQRLTRRLERVSRQREQGRRARRRAEVPAVSVVGYTNAGKSTLFNALTESSAYAADKLFATLDPTLRRLPLEGGEHAVLADTVGFISRLPHELVAAFRATLEETLEADLLLHVIDSSDPEHDEREAEVDAVLADIGASDIPCLRVYNKIDASGLVPGVCRDARGRIERVQVSALTGEGLESLRQVISEQLVDVLVHEQVRVPMDQGRTRAELFEMGAVHGESVDEEGWLLDVTLPRGTLNAYYQRRCLRPLPPEVRVAGVGGGQ